MWPAGSHVCTTPYRSIQGCKEVIVKQLGGRLQGAARNAAAIIEGGLARLDTSQHVGADGGVMGVASHTHTREP